MNPLQQIMGVREASDKWGRSPDEIQRLCGEGKLQAVRLDGGQGPWVLLKDQAFPVQAAEVPGQPETRQAPATPAVQPAAKRPPIDRGSTMSSKLRDALYE